MDAHTFTYSNYHFGKLTVDPARTCGRGGALAPVIQVSATAEFGAINLGSNSRSVLVQELSGTAVIEHAGGFVRSRLRPYRSSACLPPSLRASMSS